MTSSARRADEPREVLRAAATGEHAERGLELGEDRRLSRGEAHVARQHELAARATHATLYLGDSDEPARAEVVEQEGDRRFAGQLGGLRPVLGDPGQVDVRDEVVGVGGAEHEHLERVVGLGSLNERDQITDQLGAQKDSWAGPQSPRTEPTLPYAR